MSAQYVYVRTNSVGVAGVFRSLNVAKGGVDGWVCGKPRAYWYVPHGWEAPQDVITRERVR